MHVTATHRAGDGADEHAVPGSVLVIGIASSIDDRLRLARLLDGYGPVILTASVEEARAVLNGGAPSDHSNGSNGDRPSERLDRLAQPDSMEIDSDLLRLTHGQQHATLTPLEHDLLVCLHTEPRHTWTHAALHDAVWHNGHNGGGRADIYSVVKRLRRKLASIGAPTTIDAIRGRGFRLGSLPCHAAPSSPSRKAD